MSMLGMAASAVLGLAFVVAGASKLAAGPAWPQQARELGAPGWSITVVPWIELVVGALLVVQVARPAAAAAALGLLLAFTALIIIRLRQGRHPPCACFGAWSVTPLGPGHVARNTVLVALAVIALVS